MNQPIVSQIMQITPEQAANWLENANDKNRRVLENRVQMYAADMKAGKWRLTHQGIAFSPTSQLLDGQHRLWAIIQADVPVSMMVTFNVPPDSMHAIDGGKTRTVSDDLTIAGNHGPVTSSEVAILRSMIHKGAQRKSIDSRIAEGDLLTRHLLAIRFATSCIPKNCRRLGQSIVLAVLARAYYSIDHEVLRDFANRFYRCLNRGDGDPVGLLTQWFFVNALNGSQSRSEAYWKTERVLNAVVHREQLTRLYAANSERFPLPEEMED